MKTLKNIILSSFCVAALLIGGGIITTAQSPVLIRRADLSVPFGTISGKLVVVSDQMVFVDEDRNEESFAIARNEIQDFRSEGDIVMITTRRPIRTRDGEKMQLSFRLREGSAESLSLWAGSKQSSTVTPTTAPTAVTAVEPVKTTAAETKPAEQEQWIYNAKHPHKISLVPSGSCVGKLIISSDRVVFESLDDREHTRQWPLADIKKIKRKSPYSIEIEPFNREKYAIEIEGQGIDIGVHKNLMNRISAARQGGVRP